MKDIAKTKITEQLEKAIKMATSKIGTFSCFEVTIGFSGNERVDFMTLNTKNVWRCYEIKASISDFRSKAKKTFVGHYNYFVLTNELYELVKNEIPSHIGVYVYGTCVKKAKKQELTVSDDVLRFSMIRSLSRDATKLYKSKNPKVIENYQRKNKLLEQERNDYKRKYQELMAIGNNKYGRRWHIEAIK